ncbi:SpoIIE family protein phosphatase [Streptomyces sp. NPDC001492]
MVSFCSLARAGHPPPVVVTRDGTVDLLDLPPGPPLGLAGLPFEAAEVEVPERSLLALYTDGLIEARDHDLEAGLAQLRHALGHPPLPWRSPATPCSKPCCAPVAPGRCGPAAGPHP